MPLPSFAKRRPRTTALAALTLALALVLAIHETRVQLAYAAIGRSWPAEAAAEVARFRTDSPVLRGEPLDENAADLYRAAFAELEDVPLHTLDELPPVTAKAFLAHHRAPLALLHAATRSRRCDWGLSPLAGEEVYAERHRIYLGLTRSDELLRLEAAERRAEGDLESAAEILLDDARMAIDRSRLLVGVYFVARALAHLEPLVASDRSASLALPELRRELVALEGGLPALVDALHDGHAWLVAVAQRPPSEILARYGIEKPFWQALPQRLLVAHGVVELDRIWHDAFEAAERNDLEPWARAEDAIHCHEWGEPTENLPSRNPLVLALFPDVASLADQLNEAHVRLALLRLAIDLEQQGKPFDVSRVEVPEDPFHRGQRLSVEIGDDGRSYVLSSQGPVRFHDGVQEKRPIVLARPRPR